MSRHARIEEVSDSGSASDSDPMDMDPSDFDPANFAKAALNHQPSSVGPSLIDPANIPSQQPKQASPVDLEKFKNYQCLYPLYFDRTRTRVEGRRVGKEFAVKNPLARDIVEAVGALGLKALFEAGKLHPKDWANPGRIKVLVKENGKAVNPRVKNSTWRCFLSHLPVMLTCVYNRAPPLHARCRTPPSSSNYRSVSTAASYPWSASN